MKNSYITIHTDGACRGNPGPGGWAAIVRRYDDGEEVKYRPISGGCPDTTNNQMELTAALEGLRQICRDVDLPVIVHSDSEYLTKGMTERAPRWVAKNCKTAGGKPVANQYLWEELLAVCNGLTVSWRWIKGHSGDPRNEEADKLAAQQAKQAKARS